jgi:ribonuclease HIII
MNGLNKAREIAEIETNIQEFLKNEEFRKELTIVLLSGLRRFGFTKSMETLEQESGLRLPSGFSPEFKEFVLQGRFDQALGKPLEKSNCKVSCRKNNETRKSKSKFHMNYCV